MSFDSFRLYGWICGRRDREFQSSMSLCKPGKKGSAANVMSQLLIPNGVEDKIPMILHVTHMRWCVSRTACAQAEASVLI